MHDGKNSGEFHNHLIIISHKLELCAFALKGEHNVYSLVPNIAVCMYILTKSEFISSCSRPAVGSNIVKKNGRP